VLRRICGYRVTVLDSGLRSDAPERIRAQLDVTGAIGRAVLAFVDREVARHDPGGRPPQLLEFSARAPAPSASRR
jgi:hypothetical protein